MPSIDRRRPRNQRLDRRTFLTGLIGAAALSACGGGAADVASAPADGVDTSIRFLSPYFPAEGPVTLRSGIQQRMVWGVRDHEGIPLDDLTGLADLIIEDPNGDIVAELPMTPRGEAIPRPYLEVRHTFAEPGFYTAVLPFDDGEPLRRAFVIGSPEEVGLVQIGEWAIPSHTATDDNALGVDPVCTRNPPCGLHATSLADALDRGEPVALLISTPEFCQTAICAPALDVLLDLRDEHPDVTMIHAEVYENARETGDPLASTPAKVLMDYGMDFEPSLITIDAEGRVTERLDFVFDKSEMASALETLA